MQRFKLFIPLLVFLLLAAVFFVLQGRMATGDYDPTVLPSALVGKPMPAFSLPTLLNADEYKTGDDLSGEVSLVNVWATWCAACRAEHDYLMQLAGRGIPVYGLNYKDDRQEASLWLQRLGNPYRFNLFDADGQLGLDMGVYGAPETYLLDASGIVRYRHIGVLNERVWEKHIQPVIDRINRRND